MKHFIFTLILLGITNVLFAESVSYEIKNYDSDGDRFVLYAFGEAPSGSYVDFYNEFGATKGNRYNQIPRKQSAAFTLYGWQGCIINSITFNMCSNKSSGSFSISVAATNSDIFQMPVTDFNSSDWYGEWVSKDLGVYVDVFKAMTTSYEITPADTVEIAIKSGTQEGSVYIHRITIDYTPTTATTSNPMGYVYTKLGKNDTFAQGDMVILYRSGYAAGDIDTLVSNPYMDVYHVQSTSNVYEPALMYFTLNQQDDAWTLINQYNQALGAQGINHLVWDTANTTWHIALTFDGAEITNANTNCGIIKYNTPANSYARFSNYKTESSLPLPFLYKRVKQNEPIEANHITLGSTRRVVELCRQDTVVLKAQFSPSSTTDQRLQWHSSDNEVATVRDGIVHCHQAGTAIITATNGTISAECEIVAQQCESALENIQMPHTITINNQTIHLCLANATWVEIFSTDGKLITRTWAVSEFETTLKQGVYIIKLGVHTLKVSI